MLCVHLGPGRLGLGLIVEQLDQSQFSVCLVGPPNPPDDAHEQTEYGLASTSPDDGLGYRSVPWACNAATVDELPSEVLASIESDEQILITAALGERIAERVDFLTELVDRRPDGAETILLACENEPHDAYDILAGRCGARLTLCRCVVDRICSWPVTIATDDTGRTIVTEHPRDSSGRRIVIAHPVGEWIIATPEPVPAPLTQLAAAPLVTLITGDLGGYEARKLWSVNGVHTVLALVARLEGIRQLPLTDPQRQAFLRLAAPLLAQISEAVTHRWPEVPVDATYGPERIRAFTEAPDTTARILERYLVRHDLTPFMRRLNRRIGDAAREASAAGQDCEPFYQAMALAVSVLGDPQRYYSEKDGDPPPDELVDQAALALFDDCLQGWLDERRANDLRATLERALRDQRALPRGGPRPA